MNYHGEKECWTSVPILCQITLQNKLLVLTSFEVTTVSRCSLPYKVHFGGAKFDREWD